MTEVGPLQVFVSNKVSLAAEKKKKKNNRLLSLQCMPADLHYDGDANPPCWISEDESVRIARDDEVRLRITGMRVTATELVYFLFFRFASKVRISLWSSFSAVLYWDNQR